MRPHSVLPTPDLHTFAMGLAGGRESAFQASDYDIKKTLLKAAGLPEKWDECKVCDGHGIHPDDFAASEAWQRTEPPSEFVAKYGGGN